MARDDKSLEIAERTFRTIGWNMYRIQPPYRMCYVKGELRAIPTESGYPDFMGGDNKLTMTACEIKESTDEEKMPASRLTIAQRDFMDDFAGLKIVGILWLTGQPEFKLYTYRTGRGTYSRNGDPGELDIRAMIRANSPKD